MKIHHITIQNLLGARQIDLPLSHPVTLLAGQNGAGKSSLRDAISLALTADLCRVSKKGDAAALISEGASAARVFVQSDERDYEVAIGKNGKITDSAAGSELHPALPYVLDPARFARLNDTERRAMLFALLGIESDHKAIGERMTRCGLAEQKIAAVLPILRAGFAAGEKHAKEMASQARGAWKAVSGGESYGDKKAEGWAPPAVDVPAGADKKAENAEAQAKDVGEELAQAQQELGAARQDAIARREAAARIERLREQAGMVERIKGRLQTAEENIASCRAQLADASGKDGLIDRLAYLLDEALKMAIPFGDMDERQRGLLKDANVAICAYIDAHGEIAAPAPCDQTNVENIRRGLQTAESGAANARRDLAAAEAAAAELVELEKAQQDNATAPALDAIEARIAELTERRNQWQADARKYREAAGAAERRAQQIEQAAQHHADVQQWSAVAEALSPDGIQAEMVADAISPLNARLAEHAALAQWQPPRVDADMAISVGGRAYPLLSESEKWRADALIALTIAQFSAMRFVVLDRLDCLDAAGREDALYWLSDVAEARQIDTVLVLATLKSAPPAAALPPHITAHWIERGNLIAAGEHVKEAA